jgi:hypothetical protein
MVRRIDEALSFVVQLVLAGLHGVIRCFRRAVSAIASGRRSRMLRHPRVVSLSPRSGPLAKLFLQPALAPARAPTAAAGSPMDAGLSPRCRSPYQFRR